MNRLEETGFCFRAGLSSAVCVWCHKKPDNGEDKGPFIVLVGGHICEPMHESCAEAALEEYKRLKQTRDWHDAELHKIDAALGLGNDGEAHPNSEYRLACINRIIEENARLKAALKSESDSKYCRGLRDAGG